MNTEYEQISIIINTTIRFITAIICLAFIIPLQIKEVSVKNGLKKLRYEMLAVGIILFHINTIGLVILVVRHWLGTSLVDTFEQFKMFFNTFGLFSIAIIQYMVYNHRYTPEQKELHAKFEKMEVAAEKVAQDKKATEKANGTK